MLLTLGSVPLWEQAPFWTPALIIVCALIRISTAVRRWPVLPPVWRIIAMVGCIGALYWQTNGIFRIDMGFGVLMALIGLKMLETRTPRDAQALLLLGYFLGLCSLFMEQGLPRWLYVGGIALSLTATATHLQTGAGPKTLLPAWRLAGAMMLQALPIALLLFLFVPRPFGDFRFGLVPGVAGQGSIGMSDEMRPGTVASIATQPGRAFRAAFPGTNQFPLPPYYWRGVVLWTGDGLEWKERAEKPLKLEQRRPDPKAETIKQTITLEPQNGPWLYALDRPVSGVKDSYYEAGSVLHSAKPIRTVRIYDVESRAQSGSESTPPDQMRAALARPAQVSPAVDALAQSFRVGARDDAEVVQRALEYFRKGDFKYSYNPGTYNSNELDDFLFYRRSGFCEHYAGAFATLMRLAGVPARVVLGYFGGEESHYGRYLIVNQSDAHAWCEVWLLGKGWVRQDPTSAAAPDGLSSGLYNYLTEQGAVPRAGGAGNFGGWASDSVLREMRMLWDGLTYQWDMHVLTFNRDNQQDFLALLGLARWQWQSLLSSVLLVCAVLLGILAWWLRVPSATRDRAQALFARFCRRLGAAGLARPASEPPLAFAERAATHFPDQAAEIREIGTLYSDIRYGKSAPPIEELARKVRALPALGKAKLKA